MNSKLERFAIEGGANLKEAPSGGQKAPDLFSSTMARWRGK